MGDAKAGPVRLSFNPQLRVVLALILWLGLTALTVASAHAQPVIRFGLRILEASNARGTEGKAVPKPSSPATEPQSEAEPNERLRRILPRLQTLFRYTDYTTLDRRRVEGPLFTQQRFPVPGERWLEVTPDQLQGTSVRMRVRLLRGERSEMNANILAAPGAPAILGGPPYGNGVLIIILWANPNP